MRWLSQIILIEYNGTMKKIAIVGYKGKMGGLVYNSLKEIYEIVGIGKDDRLENFSGLDLVIDFATAESSVQSAEYCLKHKTPLIIGSTGQTSEQNKRIDEISKSVVVLKRANFSCGIEAMKKMIDEVMLLLPEKIIITEKHHILKKDAPSGTAIELKNYIESSFKKKVQVKSIREGDEKGEHLVEFYFGDEKISIKHNVFSRNAFASGVKTVINNLLN